MDKFRGKNTIELYTKDVCNNLLSIETQLEVICEKKGYDITDFQDVINDWKDGTYNVHTLERVIDYEENDTHSVVSELIASHNESNNEKLKGYSLSRFAKHAEIKALSEITGVSQSYIKKYFNIR